MTFRDGRQKPGPDTNKPSSRARRCSKTPATWSSQSPRFSRAPSAGVDPVAVTSLAAAARTLDPGASTGYDAGGKQDRRTGGGYRSDSEFLEAVAEAESDVAERLRKTGKLREEAAAALEAACAMPVKDECDGCHGMKQAAIAEAQHRIETCDAAADILYPLTQRLTAALGHLRQVPHDLGEVYELVYSFIRQGGKLPVYARWIEGGGTRA
jgi:hypothetical protein